MSRNPSPIKNHLNNSSTNLPAPHISVNTKHLTNHDHGRKLGESLQDGHGHDHHYSAHYGSLSMSNIYSNNNSRHPSPSPVKRTDSFDSTEDLVPHPPLHTHHNDNDDNNNDNSTHNHRPFEAYSDNNNSHNLSIGLHDHDHHDHYNHSNGHGLHDEETPLAFRAAYVDAIKTQFFYLGLSSGASLQMFCVSVILMFVSYSHDAGPINELSHEYYPVFRCIFFISFFFSLYGANLFIWRRAKIDYGTVLGVSYAHTYQYVLRGSTSVAYIVFSMFMLYVLTLTGGLEYVGGGELKHLWPMLAVMLPLVIWICPLDSLTHTCFGVRRNGFSQRMKLVGQ
eukprot:gene9035-18714_t